MSDVYNVFSQELLTIVTSNLMPCFNRFLPRTVGANFESFFEQMTVMGSTKGKVNELLKHVMVKE